MLRVDPAVFAVGKNYQIVVTTKTQSFVSVKIGDELFVDDSNGILRSSSRTHKFDVPQELLNENRHYTVIEKCIIKRLPYFTKTRKDKFFEYDFMPIPEKNPKAYHISDAHNLLDEPVAAAKAYGDFDFLILNGDIPNHSGTVKNFETIFDIAHALTHGTKPIVFARGNHDLRGNCAEKFALYTPADDGRTYYSFRIGNIWGICLDCGEDKPDDHAEYGFSVACHQMRIKETKLIEKIIANADNEYNAPGVTHKLVIVHVPFTKRFSPPFDIEPEIYTEWAKLLRENVKPDLMICGHTHHYSIHEPGCDYDDYGQPCKIIVAGMKEDNGFGGTGFEFTDEGIKYKFTLADGSVKGEGVL